MLTDQETNTVYLSDLLAQRHPDVAAALETIFQAEQVRYAYLQGTKDIWCRDFMPVQIAIGEFLGYRYFPDYLRGKYEHLITDVDELQGLPFRPDQVKQSDYVLDGGNVVHHRRFVCTTDKIYRENPGVDRETLRTSLESLLGAEIIVVPKEPFDFIGHTDGMLRFVDGSSVLMNDYRDIAPSYHERLVKILRKHDLQTICMPYRPSSKGTDRDSAWGNYVNYLQVGRLILFPTYEIDADQAAEAVVQRAFPNAKVIGVDCRELSEEGGVLNCVSWNIHLQPTRNDDRFSDSQNDR